MSAGFTREEAASFAAELDELLPGLPFEVCDLLPELEQRFPFGTQVWLGPRVYWRRGQPGVVAAGEPESFVKWQPTPGLVPWFIGNDGPYVFVALDDGYASWWPAGWLETR
jgi:hypothetical protein